MKKQIIKFLALFLVLAMFLNVGIGVYAESTKYNIDDEIIELEEIPEDTNIPEEEEPEEPEAEVQNLLIIPMGIETPGAYTSDENSRVVPTQLTGTAINKHTVPVIVWAKGGTVYAAVKSTHELAYMKLGGMTSTDGGIQSTTFDEYNPLVNIHVDGTEYEPDGLQGNTGDSHWTVFKFPLSELAIPTDGELAFFIKGIGGGHDVGGYMAVEVPKIDITGEKIWVGGESRPTIVLELRRYLVSEEANSAELVVNSKITLDGSETTPWTHTWKQMQEYSSYGQKYIYYVDEETVPENYEKIIDENGGTTVTNKHIELPALTIDKTADKATYSAVGEVITYTYVVTNSGNIILEGPFQIYDDNLDEDQVVEVEGPLAPGESGSATGIRTVTQADLDAGSITNLATAKFGDLTSNEDKVTVNARQATSMEVAKEGTYEDANQDEVANVGDKINYTITVKNSGNTTLKNAVVIDEMLDLNETVAEILVGETWTHTQAYDITQADIDAGGVLNTVFVYGIPTEEETELPQEPSLTVNKSADKETFSELGEIITYTYVITNTGNVTISGPFSIEDDKIGLIHTSMGSLAPGESFQETAEYEITQEDLDAGFVTNVVKVTGTFEEEEIPGEDEETVPRKKVDPVDPVDPVDTVDPDPVDPVYPEPEEPEEIIEIDDEEIPLGDKLNIEDHIQYIQGYPDNTVQPEGLITREEVAAVFFRLLTSKYRDSIRTNSHNFLDVQAGRWSAKHIATLANGNIIQGYEDGSFRPGDNITRAELATIASRFDNLNPFIGNKFSDVEGHWANKYINSASEKGWVNGYEDGTFMPDQYITRAEFVTLVNNVLNRKVKKANILPEARKFPDLNTTKWYYEAMQEAINSHHYTREENQDHETWTEIYFPAIEM